MYGMNSQVFNTFCHGLYREGRECDACVCLFKNRSGGGSSDGSSNIATCVAAPCQPQLGARLCLCECPSGNTHFSLCSMHSPAHVCYVQGVAQFERITQRNAAEPILKKKKMGPRAKSSLGSPRGGTKKANSRENNINSSLFFSGLPSCNLL